MTRRPFFASIFGAEDNLPVSEPLNITTCPESVADDEPTVSEESEQILRRGNWDYMWRKARDKDAQSHPCFDPDTDPGFHSDIAFEDDTSQSR